MRNFWCPVNPAHDIRTHVNVTPDTTVTTVFCRDCDGFAAQVTERFPKTAPPPDALTGGGWLSVHDSDGRIWWIEDGTTYLEPCDCGKDGEHYRPKLAA